MHLIGTLYVMNKLMLFVRKVRVAITPRSWLLQSRLHNGAIVCGLNRHGYGGRGVYIYRDEVEPEFTHLEKFIPQGGVFVDIGANTGIYAIKAAKHLEASSGLVIAIEPFVDVLAVLQSSVRLNRFKNVRLRNFCMGERIGVVEFWENYGRPHSFSLTKKDHDAASSHSLMVTLDDLLTWEKILRLDYLKIDAEGAENYILAGGERVLRQWRPIIQAEVNKKEVSLGLENYSVFRIRRGGNQVFIPNENPGIQTALELGWEML